MKSVLKRIQKIWYQILYHEKSFGWYSFFAYCFILFVLQDFIAFPILHSKEPLGSYVTQDWVRDDPLRGGMTLEENIHYVYDDHSQLLQNYAWVIAIFAAFLYLYFLDWLITVVYDKGETVLTKVGFFRKHDLTTSAILIIISIAIYLCSLELVDSVTRDYRAKAREEQSQKSISLEEKDEPVQNEQEEAHTGYDFSAKNEGDVVNITESSSYKLPKGAVKAENRYTDIRISEQKIYELETDSEFSRYISYIFDDGDDFPLSTEDLMIERGIEASFDYNALEFDGILDCKYYIQDSEHGELLGRAYFWHDQSGQLCCVEIESTSEEAIHKTRKSFIGYKKPDNNPLVPY